MRFLHKLSLKTKVVVVLLASTILVCSADGIIRNWHLVRCETVSWRGYTEISDHVFVDAASSQEELAEWQRVTRESQSRVRDFFGELRGVPTVICCRDKIAFRSFSKTTRSGIVTLRTLIGDYVIVDLSSRSALLISHEWVHAEIDARLGWWRSLWKVPMWFHEGLAMVVSGDTRFDEASLYAAISKTGIQPGLKDIVSWRDFNNLSLTDTHLSYGTAFKEVSLWYRRAEKKGVLRLLAGIREGEDFATLYARIEKEGGQALPSRSGN